MWSNLRALTVNLLKCPEWAPQSTRNVYILKRKKNVRINKLGAPTPKILLRREYYYDLVEDTNVTKKPPLEVVLIKDVAGIGMRGEKVEMNMFRAYRDLLLPKFAVYADSLEAQNVMKSVQEKQYSSIYSKIVENYLAGHAIKIILSNEIPWTLEPWHVTLALRGIGVLANDDCITIPKEIKGPNLDVENKDFLIYITMNKREKFPIRCRIFHWSTTDASLNQKSLDLDTPSEVLFPDEEEIIQSLIKVQNDIQRNKRITSKQNEKQSKKRSRKKR